MADRMVVTQLPEKRPRRLGISSAFQQRQDLKQLEALATAPKPSPISRAPGPAVEAPRAVRPDAASAVEAPAIEAPAAALTTDAVDKLSAWLIEQADLTSPT